MKILLDESCPVKLKFEFGQDYEVWTLKDMGWLGYKNGILMKAMGEANFELFITVDRNLTYQQNREFIHVPIIVLCAEDNRFETLKRIIPKVKVLLETQKLELISEVNL
jgi:hypothetical protein